MHVTPTVAPCLYKRCSSTSHEQAVISDSLLLRLGLTLGVPAAAGRSWQRPRRPRSRETLTLPGEERSGRSLHVMVFLEPVCQPAGQVLLLGKPVALKGSFDAVVNKTLQVVGVGHGLTYEGAFVSALEQD